MGSLHGVLARAVVQGLSERGQQLVTAESCTGGRLVSVLTEIPGASRVVFGSFVVYRPEAKMRILGLTPELIDEVGTVSSRITAALAERAREASGVEVAVAITCSAGPTAEGASEIGETYLAVATDEGTVEETHQFGGSRRDVREQAVAQALTLLVEHCGLTIH